MEAFSPSQGEQLITGRSPADVTIPGLAILPLRLFLGMTFVYAGYQKITDPGFFRAGSRTYIGTQILNFSRQSPIGGLLHHLMQVAVPIGVLTIATELVIGVLVLVGLFTRVASIVGITLNMVFFLSASWHTYPYFLGADIVFVICWLTLALTGPGPFALDAVSRSAVNGVMARWFGVRSGRVLAPLIAGPHYQPGPADVTLGRRITRAEVLAGGIVAALLVFLGVLPRGGSGTQTLAGGPSSGTGGAGTGSQSNTSAPGTGAATPAAPKGIPAKAKEIGNISQLPRNAAGTVSDPATGDPAIIIHLSDGTVVAYDGVCTHAGCTVQYDPQQHMLVCPCHGGVFDPTHDGQVVAGPPPTPLSKIEMKIDSKGNIYIV